MDGKGMRDKDMLDGKAQNSWGKQENVRGK